VRSFLAAHRVEGFVDYLVGTRPQLEAVWSDWQVATAVPRDDPELIEHSALIYGVTASGELATAYPLGFEPAAIARDLPLLAGS
jgi:cytochrome oxidase Cu insertion factor (SCO1/SenC/PrrC family)